MKYLITGKDGQLAQEFIKVFDHLGYDYHAFNHKELNIADLDSVLNIIEQVKPDIVINTAAYNQVDLAENNFTEAFNTNALGVHNLNYARKIHNFFLVHFSTDYVFDGNKNDGLYTEDDTTNPLGIYAKSKYLGETFIETNNSLIFRTSWVYGEGKQNFIYKFNHWAKNSKTLKISCDEVSVPTHTKVISDITIKSLKAGISGLYHLTNTYYCSRYELAKFIVEKLRLNNTIYPAYRSDFNLPAPRPGFSAMSNQKISDLLGSTIPSWQESLEKYLKDIN